jgi:hypothetical protein
MRMALFEAMRIDIGCPGRLFWQEENEEDNPDR